MSVKAEKNSVLLILLAALAISLPLLSNHLSSMQDSTALSVTPQGFDSLITGNRRVAVFFSTPGCPDCDTMRSIWQALSVKYSGSMRFLEVEYSLITATIFDKYDVLQTPTFILFAKGENVTRYEGSFASPEKMDQFLQMAYGNGKWLALGNQPTFLLAPESPSLLISILLGISVFASPCVLPLLPGYLAVIFAGGKKDKVRVVVASVSSFVFGTASILLVSFIFVILGDAFWNLLLMGKLLMSFVLMGLGLATLFGISTLTVVPRVLNFSDAGRFGRSVSTYSLLFGLLSIGCSLPFVVGALLNILAGVDVDSVAIRLLAFALGFACPLAVVTSATGAGLSISAPKLRKVSNIMSWIGGLSMIAASLLVLTTL